MGNSELNAITASKTHASLASTDLAYGEYLNTTWFGFKVTYDSIYQWMKTGFNTIYPSINSNATIASAWNFNSISINGTSASAFTSTEKTKLGYMSPKTNGFDDRSDSTISFTNGSRVFTIQPVATTFDYWVEGTKYSSTGATIVIGDTEGVHVIYFDGASLATIANPTSANIDTIIRTKAIVSLLYWNATDNEVIYVGDERHGKEMSPDTHSYLHFTEGLRYISGLGLNTMSVDGSGATVDSQFGIDLGAVTDEDIYHSISAVPATTGVPIYYMLGSVPRWVKSENSGYSARTYDDTISTRLAYNQFTGGNWQLTEVTSGDYVLYHIFATTEKDRSMIAIMGQADYANARAARDGALTEIRSLLLDDVLFPEIKPIATVIYQTNTSYSSPINARIISTDEGDNYIDWRNETISRVEVSTTDHGSLTGLGDDDHSQYVPVDGSRTGYNVVNLSAGRPLTSSDFYKHIRFDSGSIGTFDLPNMSIANDGDHFWMSSLSTGDLSVNRGSSATITISASAATVVSLISKNVRYRFEYIGTKENWMVESSTGTVS